jgi:hypothetical protein
MACRGVHFAITEAEVERLCSLPSDEDVLEYLQEVIEEEYFEDHPEFVAESDKAWDALHRALAGGEFTSTGGAYPLNHAVLAGEILYFQPDYILTLKTPAQVRDVAAALPAISEAEFRRRYFAIDPESYGCPLTEEDLSCTWEAFQVVREFFERASREGRYVLFTADQ